MLYLVSLASVCYVISYTFRRLGAKLTTPLTTVITRYLAGSVFVLGYLIFSRPTRVLLLSTLSLQSIGYASIIFAGSFFGGYVFNRVLAHHNIGLSVSLLKTLIIILSGIIGYIFFKEKITFLKLMGIIFCIIGIYLIVK